jgi:hypothetical protein
MLGASDGNPSAPTSTSAIGQLAATSSRNDDASAAIVQLASSTVQLSSGVVW